MSGDFTADLPSDSGIRRILVMRWSAMGDVALASCAFQDIFDAFPRADIHLNTLAPWDRLFIEDPRFKKIICMDLRGKMQGIPGMFRWLREIGGGGYDAVFDLQSNDRSRILMSLLRFTGRAPRYRVGNHRRWPYNVAPPPQPKPVHALDHLRATLDAGGVPTLTRTPVLHPPRRNRERALKLLKQHALGLQDYGIFLPGCQAAGYLKRWGARRFIALAMGLERRGLGRVLLLGADEDAEECREIELALNGFAINLCGSTELLDIVPLAEGARVIVANDTGTAHVASAAGRPMVVVCGPTDPRRVKPAGEMVSALQSGLYCINCYLKHCSHHSCMMLVTPEQVLDCLRDLGAFEAR
ncbi:MAG: glycosyltransferase family 9 protein [Gammaproteobacteria bacterium]|nr:glycosyltransferase family 9 protein [Gammaproteobacteria bacterium]MDH3411324.1 glycosyltransferase family 9 protein [Gammaproteobacteria bacterium]